MLRYLIITIGSFYCSHCLCAAEDSEEEIPFSPITACASAPQSEEWDTLSADSGSEKSRHSTPSPTEDTGSPSLGDDDLSFEILEFLLGDDDPSKASGRGTPAPWTNRYLDRGKSIAVRWN